ncbi:MAG: hypothetical protein ACRDTJ_21815, partial [Pseudonocardiaceae bacterium]
IHVQPRPRSHAPRVDRQPRPDVLCATRSPIIASAPGAENFKVSGDGDRAAACEDLELVGHRRKYLTTRRLRTCDTSSGDRTRLDPETACRRRRR